MPFSLYISQDNIHQQHKCL